MTKEEILSTVPNLIASDESLCFDAFVRAMDGAVSLEADDLVNIWSAFKAGWYERARYDGYS